MPLGCQIFELLTNSKDCQRRLNDNSFYRDMDELAIIDGHPSTDNLGKRSFNLEYQTEWLWFY